MFSILGHIKEIRECGARECLLIIMLNYYLLAIQKHGYFSSNARAVGRSLSAADLLVQVC
jgi:hypothetical protein